MSKTFIETPESYFKNIENFNYNVYFMKGNFPVLLNIFLLFLSRIL